jgi:hypothetical protein
MTLFMPLARLPIPQALGQRRGRVIDLLVAVRPPLAAIGAPIRVHVGAISPRLL